MGTLVAPMGSETVAMPAANRWRPLHAFVVFPERLNIVEDAVDVDGRAQGLWWGLRIKAYRQSPALPANINGGLVFSDPPTETNQTRRFTDNLRLADIVRRAARHSRRINPPPHSPRIQIRPSCSQHAVKFSSCRRLL